ncbi:hypothetical protein [Microbacterium immunditiarum]|uniref:Uncharacterized protein n=1 Tax=Microbacterium immunditiarum TaxID=337480 RepID=A0A7Y9GL66_9MICO|nr:hypothetical protein [Microbacterium immunditiarum]NYE18553.1 hypothetical protein [Microbacterium immunditiarum]
MSTPGDADDRTDVPETARAYVPRPTRGAFAWLGILLAIAVVQLARGQWGDAAVFAVAGSLVVAESTGLLVMLERLVRPRTLAVAAGAVAAGVVLMLAPRHSVAAGAAMIGVGVAAAIAAWAPARSEQRRPRAWPSATRRLAWSWAAVWLIACLWEVAQVTLGGSTPGGRAAHPALSDIVNPLLDVPLGKGAFVVVWLALGVFLIRRGTTGRAPSRREPDL